MSTRRKTALPAEPGTIELCYAHRHGLFDTGTAEPETWTVTADVYTVDDEPDSHVGSLELVRVDPYRSTDTALVLDSYDADLGLIGATILDMRHGGLDADLESRLEVHGNDLLIIHELQLDAEWRGHGLGPLLAGLAIKRLSGGCQAAVCYPAPLEWDETNTDAQWGAATASLAAMCSRVGFQHFRNGVYVLDLALITLDDAITRMQHQLRHRGER